MEFPIQLPALGWLFDMHDRQYDRKQQHIVHFIAGSWGRTTNLQLHELALPVAANGRHRLQDVAATA
jgi:hypothetical protein